MFKIPKVNFGLLDKYYEKKTNKNFKQQIDNIMSTKQFTLIEYQSFIDGSLQNIKKGIFTKLFASQEQEEAELLEQQKILKAIFPNEKRNIRLIKNDILIQNEIAEIAQTSIERLNWMFTKYQDIYNIHSLLSKRKQQNKPLPETQDEMTFLIRKGFKQNYLEQKDQQRKKVDYINQQRKIQRNLYIMKKRQNALKQKNIIYKIVKKSEDEY